MSEDIAAQLEARRLARQNSGNGHGATKQPTEPRQTVRMHNQASDRPKAAYAPDPHRLLPQSPDAEKGLLGTILLNPSDICGLCSEKLVTPEHFHIPAHATIFETIMDLWNSNQPIEFITLCQKLSDAGKLDQAGGAPFVTDLCTFVPTSANASYYLEIVQEKYTLRQMISTCTEYAARCYDEQENVSGLLDEAETKIFAIAEKRYTEATDDVGMKELVHGAIEAIEKMYERRGQISGISTGLHDLDAITDGLHGSEMWVIAGRPSMGKTALAMNIAEHISTDQGLHVGVFSAEMSKEQLIQRMLLGRARVSNDKMRNGFFSEADFAKLTATAAALMRANLHVCDKSSPSISYLSAVARRWYKKHKLAVIIIDYLQLLSGSNSRYRDNRQMQITEISAGIKGLCKALNIPIIVCAQLNRNPEGRTGENLGVPRLSDLRESGSIEQDADVVGLLYRPEYYASDDEAKSAEEGKAILIIAKQRNGPVGEIPMTFIKNLTRFEDRARIDEKQ